MQTSSRNFESGDGFNVESNCSRFFAMERLLLPSPEKGGTQTCFLSDHPPQNLAPALLGQILAGRYKILKVIDVSTFKGHDLALDQTVKIREELLAPQGERDIWRQKATELMQVRNPNFLNIIDIVSDGSSDFIISEYSRGRSIPELLGQRSPLNLDDALALMRPVADALDLIATPDVFTTPHSSRCVYAEAEHSFKRRLQFRLENASPQFSDSSSFSLKLDVWELVKSRKDVTFSFLGSKAQKIASKKLAVWQMALLAYDLFCGENRRATEVEYRFEPINRLGKAGNAVLHRALRGSLLFWNANGFLHKLESAIRSDTSQWDTRGVETCRKSMAYPGTNEVLRKFNRDTELLAAGLLGAVACVALLFAVLMPESRRDKGSGLREASRARPELVVNAVAAEPSRIAPPEAKRSEKSEIATTNDQKFGETSAKEDFPDTKTSAGSTQSTAIMSDPEISRNAGSLNQSKSSQRQSSASTIRDKSARERSRSSRYPKVPDVKRQLIALWRKSLRQAEQPRSWAISSKLNRKKHVAFAAGTKP